MVERKRVHVVNHAVGTVNDEAVWPVLTPGPLEVEVANHILISSGESNTRVDSIECPIRLMMSSFTYMPLVAAICAVVRRFVDDG